MKFVGYEESSQTILVSFASDTTSSPNPDSYSPVSFQPYAMWPDVTTMNELQKKMAAAGIAIVKQQIAKETVIQDLGKIRSLQGLVGQSNTFAVSDLVDIETPNPTPFHTV